MNLYCDLVVLLFLFRTSLAYENITSPSKFNIAVCSQFVSSLIENGTITRTSDGVSSHQLMLEGVHIGEERMIPNISGNLSGDGKTYFLFKKPCQDLCGKGWEPYQAQAIASGIMTWLFPVFLLIGNMCLADLGSWGKFLTIIHMLGDPIDSIWSLLSTVEVRRRGYVWALERGYGEKLARAIADVVSVVNDVGLEQKEQDDPQAILKRLEEWEGHANFRKICFEAARGIKNGRVREVRRGMLAIFLYLSSIIYAFISALRFEQEKPGGRIACATQYGWLVLIVVISSFAGKANTRECYPKVMRKFERALGTDEERIQSIYGPEDRTATHKTIPKPFLLTHGVNTFRRRKSAFSSNPTSDRYRQPWVLLIVSFLPVFFSSTMALCISWITPPLGLKCKTYTHLFISICWFASVVVTKIAWIIADSSANWKIAAIIIPAKDAIITFSSMIVLILGNYGVLFSCYCTTTGNPRGMELDSNYRRASLLVSVYPGLALGGLGGIFIMTLACVCLLGIIKVSGYPRDTKSDTELLALTTNPVLPTNIESSHSIPPIRRELTSHFV